MKVLYAIQGTGNGHISRAMEILPALQKRVEVDLLVSGMHSELRLPCTVKYPLKGLGFKFGKKGGVDYFNTWRQGDVTGFLKEIRNLDLTPYDLVVNDFEPVSAWAARRQHVPCVGLSNQCALFHHDVGVGSVSPSPIARSVFKTYAPLDAAYGFSYQASGDFVFTPIIRRSIREATKQDKSYYLVYLPFYKDSEILAVLSKFKEVKWKLFSKHSKTPYQHLNVKVYPISDSHFNYALAAAKGVLCGAGFGTTSEALYLGKKLMVIPMKNQYEQLCNAEMLKKFDVSVIKSLKSKWHGDITTWLERNISLEVQFPDQTQLIVDRILGDFAYQHAAFHEILSDRIEIKAEGS